MQTELEKVQIELLRTLKALNFLSYSTLYYNTFMLLLPTPFCRLYFSVHSLLLFSPEQQLREGNPCYKKNFVYVDLKPTYQLNKIDVLCGQPRRRLRI